MRVAVYIRVSTEEQAKEGYSISAQKQKLIAFCVSQGWEVSSVYVDEGISAKDMNRPQLQQMIKDIQDRLIDCVLVYRLDRLTRSVLDLYTLLQTFDKYDCKFKSATEVFETTTAIGRMFITIVAAMAQWERENMGERIALGYAEKVRQGKYALNFRPIGYDLDLKTGKLTINEDEAQTIRLIFDLYENGYGANRVCKFLNESGIKTKAGNKWNDKPLIQIIKNPLYKGSVRWNNVVYESTHEAIIEPKRFDLIQEILVKRRNAEPRSATSDYIFSGKLKCNVCGYSLGGFKAYHKLSTGKKAVYKNYRCLRKKNGECTGFRSISERNLEEAFLEYLEQEDFSESLDQTAATAESLLNKKIPKENVDINALQKELDKIGRRKKKWQYAWADDDETISYEDFKKRMQEANEEEERIKAVLSTLFEVKDEKVNVNKSELLVILKDTRKNWNKLVINEKKNAIDSIIDQIHVDYHGDKLSITSIDFY